MLDWGRRAFADVLAPLLLALTLLWGGSFFFTGVAVTELPPFSLVLARVGLAALILQGALVVLAGGHRGGTGAPSWSWGC